MARRQQLHKAALLTLLYTLLCGFIGAEEDLFTAPIDSPGGWERQCWPLLVSGVCWEHLAKARGRPVILLGWGDTELHPWRVSSFLGL